jgi:predicted peptidase
MDTKFFYSSLVYLLSPASIVMMISGCGTSSNLSTPTRTSTTNVRTGQYPQSATIQIDTANHITQTTQIEFLLYIPDKYGKDPQQKWPLMLFLHGMGERGSDLELLKRQPLPKTLDTLKDFPFIVISPQLPLTKIEWNDMIDPLAILLDQIETKYSIDTQRIYLTGLSMGGFGTWNFALRYPKRFAAIVPIAGGIKYQSTEIPQNICDIKNLPIWAFHGAKDAAVPAWQSENLVNALRACGSDVRFTLYPDADHVESWLQAYANPELYTWLLAQTLK